jgi:hypothetical protein
MRIAGLFLLAALAAAGPVAAQTAGLSAHCDGSSIVVDFSGPSPGPYSFNLVWRMDASECGPWTAVGDPVWAQPGEMVVVQRIDSGVIQGHIYHYRFSFPADYEPPPYPFLQVYVYDAWVGCGDTPIVRGTLHSVVVDDATYVAPTSCLGTCGPNYIIRSYVDLTPYVDTTTEVALFGSVFFYLPSAERPRHDRAGQEPGAGAPAGWMISVDSVEPSACDQIAVQPGHLVGPEIALPLTRRDRRRTIPEFQATRTTTAASRGK